MSNRLEEEKTARKILFGTVAVFLLTGFCVFLETLCLKEMKSEFIANNFTWIFSSCLLFSSTYAVLCIAFLAQEKGVLFRTLFSGLILFFALLLLYYFLLKSGLFDVINSPELYEQYLKDKGKLMPLFYIVLQFLQVVVLPIPGFVSTAAGVALFGPFKAMLCSLVGIITGSILAFLIGRKIGYKAVSWMVGKNELDKWLKKVKGKDNFILTAMFLLPLFPDDILCFVAGLSSMTWQYFVVMIVCARVVSISATCYSVELIPFNTWWGILLWIGFIVLIIVGFIILYKNTDKLNEFFHEKFKTKRKRDRKKSNGEN